MANTMLKFKMVTPVQTVFEQEVEQVIVTTEAGQITVLPDHSKLVSILQPGEMIVRENGQDTPMAVLGGFLEVSENQLVILADAAELPSDIDVTAAEQRAADLAKELESQEHMEVKTYTLLQKQLLAEQARIFVANKWRK